MRESPAQKLIELLETAGANVSYHDPHVPEFDELGLELRAARARALRLRRDRHGALRRSTTTTLVRRAQVVVDFRNATAGDGPGRPRSGSCERSASAGRASATGARTSPATSTASPISPGSATSTERRARRVRRAVPAARRRPRRLRGDARAIRSSMRSSIATPVPTHYALARAGARGGQARLRREAAGDARRGDGRAGAARGGARPRAHARPPAALPPGRAEAEGARRQRRRSATCSASTATARTSASIRKDENALWSLGVHDLSVILYLVGEEPERGVSRTAAIPHAGSRGRRLLLPPLPEREDRAHAPLVARPAQDAEDHRRRPRQDGRLRRHGAGAQGDGVREGAVEARRRATASGRRAPATSSARRSRTTSR